MNNKDKWVDLHLHTTKSDGTLSPKKLLQLSAQNNLKNVAITDHDTVSGVKEAEVIAKKLSISLIPGIEISAKYKVGTLHILGYNIDIQSHNLLLQMNRCQKIRQTRNIKIIEKLRNLGMEVSDHEMQANYKEVKSLGRPHIAAILLEKGFVSSMQEAFDKYLSNHGKAYISKEVFSPEESIDIIHKAGGQAFIAHPATLGLNGQAFKNYIYELKQQGLDGLEVFSSSHSSQQIDFSQSVCQ